MSNDEFTFDLKDTDLECNIVTAGFQNLLPASMNVTIIKIESTVTFEDGTTEVLGPRNVSIGPGGKDETLHTSCTSKCARSVFGKLTILDRQGQVAREVIKSKTRYPDTATQCLIFAIFPIGKN